MKLGDFVSSTFNIKAQVNSNPFKIYNKQTLWNDWKTTGR